MSISLRGFDRGVSKEFLDVIDRDAIVHQDGCKAVAKIVNPKIRQSCIPSCLVPCIEDASIGFARYVIWEDEGVARIVDGITFETAQEVNG